MILALIDATFEELQYPIYAAVLLAVTGLLLFAFYRPFRKGLLDYIKNQVFFVTVFLLYPVHKN